jgi:hypothetical protein
VQHTVPQSQTGMDLASVPPNGRGDRTGQARRLSPGPEVRLQWGHGHHPSISRPGPRLAARRSRDRCRRCGGRGPGSSAVPARPVRLGCLVAMDAAVAGVRVRAGAGGPARQAVLAPVVPAWRRRGGRCAVGASGTCSAPPAVVLQDAGPQGRAASGARRALAQRCTGPLNQTAAAAQAILWSAPAGSACCRQDSSAVEPDPVSRFRLLGRPDPGPVPGAALGRIGQSLLRSNTVPSRRGTPVPRRSPLSRGACGAMVRLARPYRTGRSGLQATAVQLASIQSASCVSVIAPEASAKKV